MINFEVDSNIEENYINLYDIAQSWAMRYVIHFLINNNIL